MKTMHWSELYLNFITIEITYDDGARQVWDYDCSQYETLDALKSNMTSDFQDPRLDRDIMFVHFTRHEEDHSVDIPKTKLIGKNFTEFVFETIEEAINGN